MTETPPPSSPAARPKPSADDIALSRKVFFGMMGTVAFLLACLIYGALR